MSHTKVIALTNPKGGTGKSNASRTIAKGLELAGFKVVVGETDPQKSLLEWSLNSANGEVPLIKDVNAGSETLLRKSIEELKENHGPIDFIVVDGCAFDFRLLNTVLNVTDLAIIPTQASPDDICQLGEVLDLIHGIKLKRKNKGATDLLARTMINKAKLGTSLLTESRELLANPNDSGIYCLNTAIRDYEAIRRAAGVGKTAFECGNKKAKEDAQNLVSEILELLK